MGSGLFGLALIAAFAILQKEGKALRLSAVCAILGAVLVGTSGTVGGFTASIVRWLMQHGVSHLLSWAFGVTAQVGLAVVTLAMATMLAIHLKDARRARKHTGWIALALGLVIAAGASGIGGLNQLPANLQSSFHVSQGR